MPLTITFKEKGSLKLRGDFQLIDEDGNTLPHEMGYVKLCKCGQSKNQPYCDDSHREI